MRTTGEAAYRERTGMGREDWRVQAEAAFLLMVGLACEAVGS
jgi:hypothetical protein